MDAVVFCFFFVFKDMGDVRVTEGIGTQKESLQGRTRVDVV